MNYVAPQLARKIAYARASCNAQTLDLAGVTVAELERDTRVM